MLNRPSLATLSSCVLLILISLLAVAFLLISYLRSQPLYPQANAITLKSISMDSADDGWAVGLLSGAPGDILYHYHSGKWTIIRPPSLPGLRATASIDGVSMLTEQNGWAIGNTAVPTGSPTPQGQSTSISVQPTGILLHYVDGNWTIIKTYPSTKLLQISLQSATSGWLLAENYSTASQTVLLHFDGNQWTNVKLPKTLDNTNLWTFSALANNNLWFTDFSGSLVHYEGTRWTQIQVCDNCVLTHLTMISSNEGWAVGNYYNDNQGSIFHYQDGQWNEQSRGKLPGIDSICMLSASEGWASSENKMFHYTHGSWTEVDSPTNQELFQITMLSSTDGWAVGQLGTILHYENGSWSIFSNITYQSGALESYQ